jgi:hypothetical protein
VARLYPRTLGSVFIASYDSQGSGAGILTSLQTAYILLSLVPVLITSGYEPLSSSSAVVTVETSSDIHGNMCC